ncbi:3'-phosphoesterase [Candidatus Bathyarchaeota archaeon]|nr:3'-phosphoesterase [Candidatus Bathyarchaeota archaeon]
MSLQEYNAKRDFSKTSEPLGQYSKDVGNKYMIHEHHATRLHWDLRLEKEGVLKSWALPKEPVTIPGIRRLAIQVEDHPLNYGDFEGTIPEGEYGAGLVKIWDKGFYKQKIWSEEKINITIFGEKLTGEYELIRFKKAGEKEWLLFKKKEN